MYFPEWSDLGKNVSDMQRNSWETELANRERYLHYFSGRIFDERIPMEAAIDEDAPMLYPVGMNIVKMLCLAQSDAMFGEWDDQVFQFASRSENDKSSMDAIQLLDNILMGSNGNSMFWEAELNRNVLGGAAIKVSPILAQKKFVKWSLVPMNGFFPVWDPDDHDELLEVYVMMQLTREQAKLRYGVEGTGETCMRMEHWTRFTYENMIDGKRLDAFSGVNPWGVVPFAYIPRYRSSSWWGEAMTEDLIKPQDEVNMVVADMGEALNYNAHPVRWANNLPRAFNRDNFPVGPNAMWDLGRTLGNMPTPEIGMLEAKNPVPEPSFKYLNFIYNWARVSSFSPPIVFGEDENAGSTGATLEIRMWPLIKAIRRSRAYASDGMRRIINLTGQILKQKKFPGVPVRAIDSMLNEDIIPVYESILPRDHRAIVDEVVKLNSTTPISISLETSQKILGRGTGEVQRIREMINDKELFPKEVAPSNDIKEAIAGKQVPQENSSEDSNSDG